MNNNILRLEGKRVLVTGASSGLGAHFAEILSAAGAELVLTARRLDKLEEIKNKIHSAGGTATAIQMDVCSEESVVRSFQETGPLDVVINNAGISIIGSVDEMSESEWDQVIDTNLKGVWLVSKAAIKAWKTVNKSGNLINIASIAGIRPSNQLPPYIASKGAVIQLTKSIALDCARFNIRCNALCPGYIETDMNRTFLNSEAGHRQIKRIPFRRTGQLSELDGPLLLLASDASSYMSGSILVVDGAHLCSTL
ncbi:MAG: SDR family oxidoreductase [SAR324 cluster bacterium]|nr:SDR family oxidoreductase [SAR324 cluster bacterium]